MITDLRGAGIQLAVMVLVLAIFGGCVLTGYGIRALMTRWQARTTRRRARSQADDLMDLADALDDWATWRRELEERR